jgi:signal transduction histidine kinase
LVPQATDKSALADAAHVLSDQLKAQIARLAALLGPHAERLEREFETHLRRLGYSASHRSGLSAITAGAAARVVARGRPLGDFLEQVEYQGRRLAKLHLPPSGIVKALEAYDQLLAPLAGELVPAEALNLRWAREQLTFLVLLALNRAYYHVREAEAETFYELFRTQGDSRTLDELLEGSLRVLARFSGAQEAHVFLLDGAAWKLRATTGSGNSVPPAGATAALRRNLSLARSFAPTARTRNWVLDPAWVRRFAWVWSVPLRSAGFLAGVMQFGFSKRYDWLPRERELLAAASARCVAAIEKARLIEDLKARQQLIRRLAEHMLHVEEVERRRISRELHDETGQSLLYIRLQLELLEQELPEGLEVLRQRLAQIREVAESTILETRRLIGALSPAVLEQLGLAAAIRQLAARLRQRHPCRVRLRLGRLGPLPKTVETVAYRLVQECCHNIARHSQAESVNIAVSSADQFLRLCVEDDGVGLPAKEVLAGKETFGLAGMQERVSLLGGKLEIETRRGSGRSGRPGTRIVAWLPLPPDGSSGENSRESPLPRRNLCEVGDSSHEQDSSIVGR